MPKNVAYSTTFLKEPAWASVPAYPNSGPPPELQRRDAMADLLTRHAKP